MKGKLLTLAAIATISFSSLAHMTSVTHTHSQTGGELDYKVAPGLIMKPFNFEGRSWFDTDKSVLRPAGRAKLTAFAADLLQAKNLGKITNISQIDVIGHTDSRASRAYNQRLSERRAKAVVNFLVSKGIDSSTISAYGRGETQPVATNRTRKGMQENRRVEIRVVGSGINVVND